MAVVHIVRILGDEGDVVGTQFPFQRFGYGGFSGAGASGDAYNQHDGLL